MAKGVPGLAVGVTLLRTMMFPCPGCNPAKMHAVKINQIFCCAFQGGRLYLLSVESWFLFMTLSDKCRMILADSLNPPLLLSLSCKVKLILSTCLTEPLEDIPLMPVKCSKKLPEKQTRDVWILEDLIQLLRYKASGSGNEENCVELQCLNAKSPSLVTGYVDLFTVWPLLTLDT